MHQKLLAISDLAPSGPGGELTALSQIRNWIKGMGGKRGVDSKGQRRQGRLKGESRGRRG